MTYQEAQDLAITAGALKPKGILENIAAAIMLNQGRHWSDTERAKHRLEDWTQIILTGRDPQNG